jgi:intracellular sulfur oxidation DsrE/DsrF family protein
MKNINVVLHIDINEEARLTMALKNIVNLLKEVEMDDAFINLLMNGSAPRLFKVISEESQKSLAGLILRKVRVCVCKNALYNAGMTESDLPAGCDVVPAGILELIDLQTNRGCAYIKP